MIANFRQSYIDILKKEVVPAMGCTEPIAVAYACAKAREILGQIPDRIELYLSPNILKNGMGVGIPGTGMSGLEIAAAIGAAGGNASKILNVLEDVAFDDVAISKKMVADKKIKISIKENTDPLYIEALLLKNDEKSRVIIENSHANIILTEKNDEVIYSASDLSKDVDEKNINNKENLNSENNENYSDGDNKVKSSNQNQDVGDDKSTLENKSFNQSKQNETHDIFSVKKIFEFSNTMPLDEINFVYDLTIINDKLSVEGLSKPYGHSIGQVLDKNIEKGLLADDLLTYTMKRTAAATDARMAGCMLPAMSNSGSGNQGITVSMPVIAAAEKLNSSKEQLTRALTMASLMSIYIKSNMKRLSALCGAMTAGTAASCGITYLLGGDLDAVERSVQNMIGNLTGIICDGAKPNCAMKVATGVSTAVISSLFAMDNIGCNEFEGIVDKNVDQSIKNLGRIAAYSMQDTDKMILDIMVDKN